MRLFKKKNKDEDLSIVDDYHEAFTWSGFWDEQVMGRIKKIHDFLQEHGILFFLMSPFQYKNRLIVKIILIIFGVLAGIVPRSIQMLNETKARNAASELAQTQGMSTDTITVTPLASSQYRKQHLLVFNIGGQTSDGVPSTANGFNVRLSEDRGVDDGDKVRYKYSILPVDDSNRLLVMYVDNRKQNDLTGIYDLRVSVKGMGKMDNPMEIILSNTQKTHALFNENGVDLAPISEKILKEDGTEQTSTIRSAQRQLSKALDVYRINAQRLMAGDMEPAPSSDKLKSWCDSVLVMTNLTDKSTVADLTEEDDKIAGSQRKDDQPMTAAIKYNGKTYKSDDDQDTEQDSDNTDQSKVADDDDSDDPTSKIGKIKQTEAPNLQNYLDDVQQAVQALNQARVTTYGNLKMLQKVLSEKIDVNDMGPSYKLH